MLALAQNNVVSGVNSFRVSDAGTIMDKNKDVDGYYFFYKVDKLKKGKAEFAIKILDKNLVEVANKSYVDHKNTVLLESKFNNNAMMFVMANFNEKKIDLVSFDRQVNQRPTVSIALDSKESRYIMSMLQTGTNPNFLFAVDNKGFIFNKIEDNKKIGYSLKYYPTNGGKAWEYNSPEDTKEILSFLPIDVNEKTLIGIETSRKGAMSRKVVLRTKVIDVDTGKLLFEREFSKDSKPRFITNAFLNSSGNVALVGEYYKEGDNIFDDKSLGLFSEIIDLSGKTIKESFTSWDVDVAKVAKVKNNYMADRGYIFFHDIIKTNNNDYYAIGEFYRKTASAAGIAQALLTRNVQNVTQLSITNAVVFKFDSNFKLKEIKEFKKSISRAPSLADFGSPQLNAHALKHFGAFDFQYTQVDRENDRFYACFIDYERLKGEKNKNAFKTIIYDEGELSEDKIYLKRDGVEFRVLPGKMGTVLLLEYNKKAKELGLHFEKLNIK